MWDTLHGRPDPVGPIVDNLGGSNPQANGVGIGLYRMTSKCKIRAVSDLTGWRSGQGVGFPHTLFADGSKLPSEGQGYTLLMIGKTVKQLSSVSLVFTDCLRLDKIRRIFIYQY